MSNTTAVEIIVTKRIDQLTLTGDPPIDHPGITLDPPDGPWVRYRLLWGDGFEVTLDGLNDLPGVLVLDAFGKPGDGDGAVMTLLDELREAFNRTIIEPIKFSAPSGPRVIDEKSDWIHYQSQVRFSVLETVEV